MSSPQTRDVSAHFQSKWADVYLWILSHSWEPGNFLRPEDRWLRSSQILSCSSRSSEYREWAVDAKKYPLIRHLYVYTKSAKSMDFQSHFRQCFGFCMIRVTCTKIQSFWPPPWLAYKRARNQGREIIVSSVIWDYFMKLGQEGLPSTLSCSQVIEHMQKRRVGTKSM